MHWAGCRVSFQGRGTGVGRATRAAPAPGPAAARAAIVLAPRCPAGGLEEGRRGLAARVRPRSLPAGWPRAAGPFRTLPAVAPGRGADLRASGEPGAGSASGPSDHLWKRRGGGCLLAQLQQAAPILVPRLLPASSEQAPARLGRGGHAGELTGGGAALRAGAGGRAGARLRSYPRLPLLQVGRLLEEITRATFPSFP